MLRIGILGSTRGTSMMPIISAIEQQTLQAQVAVVLSNQKEALILSNARDANLLAYFMDPTGLTREQYDAHLADRLQKHQVDVVLLIGYMRILTPGFLAQWPGRIFNIHPSLLPQFAHKMNNSVHEAVLAAGVTETGCTVHEVTAVVDAGPIVLQKKCAVLAHDTVESLKARVQQLEGEALVQVLQNVKMHTALA